MLSMEASRMRSEAPEPGWRLGALVVLGYTALYVLFFAPVLCTGRLLVPGDGVLQYLPAFLGEKSLWESFTFGGFPHAADPQNLTWYPLMRLFALTGWWNGFVIAAYVLASSCTFGLVWRLTGCRLAAAAAGIIYGISGFMTAHLGHATILHSAAWFPLVLWSVEELRRRVRAGWVLALALA